MSTVVSSEQGASTVADSIEYCYEAGWSDGLPVVPPTQELVQQMLGVAVARRHEPVASLRPQRGVASFEKVAANAVMAGCLPSYFPVVVAAVRAVADKEFWLEDMVTAVDPTSPLLLVSGPIAVEIDMNGDAGALGPGCRANATIGRALNLCLRNIAGFRPIRQDDERALDGCTIGHPGKFTYCYAENVAASPWPTLSVDRGFGPAESTVTVYAADAPLCIVDMSRTEPELILRTIAESLAIPGTTNAFHRQDLWLIMSPEHANLIADAGWSKADVQRHLFEHARIPAEQLLERGLYGLMDSVMRPSWLDDAEPGELIPIVDSPQRVVVTVAGAPYGGYTSVCFGFGASVTRPIAGSPGDT